MRRWPNVKSEKNVGKRTNEIWHLAIVDQLCGLYLPKFDYKKIGAKLI